MKKYYISVDLGGTSIKFGLFDSENRILKKWKIATNPKTAIEDIAIEIMKFNNVFGVVIGVPGPVKKGVVLKCFNLDWGKVPVQEILESKLDLPVFVLNDANLQALGESDGYESLFLVTLGTGIGGAYILNDEIVEGFRGCAGEIEHYNSMNLKASKKGLESYFKNLTAEEIIEKAQYDDECYKVVHEEFYNLGKMIALACLIVDPEIVIIGGGLSNAGEFLLNEIKEGFDAHSFTDIPIRLSAQVDDAAIRGAQKIIKKNS